MYILPSDSATEVQLAAAATENTSPQPLLLTGANGTLGQAFQHICAIRGLHVVALGRAELDIADPVSVEMALSRYQPWAVINAAGYVRVDDAEADFACCYRENTTGPTVLAAACAGRQLPFLTFSSDLVFDGLQTVAYTESSAPRPLNVYGNSKRLAEREVLAAWPRALVVRTSAFFGPWDQYNFVHHVLAAARAGERFEAISDAVVSPTYVPDLVNTALDLLIDEEQGIWHLANEGACTWAELAAQAGRMAGFDPGFLVPRPLDSFRLAAPRPLFSALASEHGALLPSVESGLERYLTQVGSLVSAPTAEIIAAAS
jgi:dTDP-4-dehydrorhamnose reductase